jgi:hypothetical protein
MTVVIYRQEFDDTSPDYWTISRIKFGFWIGSGLLPIGVNSSGRLLAQRTVWPILVMVLAPVFNRLPRFNEGEKILNYAKRNLAGQIGSFDHPANNGAISSNECIGRLRDFRPIIGFLEYGVPQ